MVQQVHIDATAKPLCPEDVRRRTHELGTSFGCVIMSTPDRQNLHICRTTGYVTLGYDNDRFFLTYNHMPAGFYRATRVVTSTANRYIAITKRTVTRISALPPHTQSDEIGYQALAAPMLSRIPDATVGMEEKECFDYFGIYTIPYHVWDVRKGLLPFS